MGQYRWYDVLDEISKVERKYNIKNPNLDNGFPGVARDYGFAPVDTKGDWWTRIPNKPDLPIIYAPIANTSYTIPTGIGGATVPGLPGTTTTGLIDTVNCIGDATFTEIPTGGTALTVTTGGVATGVSSAVGTAAVGAALGFGVGVGWFEAQPEFWTNVSNAVFGTDLDPAEIGEMARDTNALVVIKDGLCYMAEDMINAIRDAFFDNGAADTTSTYPTYTDTAITITDFLYPDTREYMINLIYQWMGTTEITTQLAESLTRLRSLVYDGTQQITLFLYVDGGVKQFRLEYSNPQHPENVVCYELSNAKGYYETSTSYLSPETYTLSGSLSAGVIAGYGSSSKVKSTKISTGKGTFDNGNIIISNLGVVISPAVDGITPTGQQGTKDQPIAILFPDWVSRGIETIAGDGVTKVKWLPISLPSNMPLVDGIPFSTTEAQQGTLPDNYTETATKLGEQAQEQTKNAPSFPTPPIPPVPDVTPTPDDPAIAGGGGSATGLANLYNPTLAQIKQFSRWLWGSDGLNLDQLKKLLQDPMQAIIGLHVMYATPTTGANRDIQVGYINSGVPSKIVTEQYTEINCGTVTINEYFGDARDYSPYTQVYCYLPFIGIVELNADDVVNSTLGIKYKIDVLTGCCLAQLTVKKYGLNAVLYTYTGNCAVQMPITSGNYLSTVSSLLGAVVSGAAAVATGGALAPVAIGAAANAMGGGARASVAMSGSLGSNAGAMGIRKPYLIIKRVESADANGYNEFYGYPTNKRVNLSQLTGYVRVKEINLSGTNATEDEQNEIVTLLKEGVIL